MLVLGTYRPADVAGTAHPLRSLKQELEVHGHCEEMPLEFLSALLAVNYCIYYCLYEEAKCERLF